MSPTRICDGDAVRAPELLGVAGCIAPLHVERGVARPHGVVLVGERRAEERHDPVAHDLVDGALVAVDGLHHPLEHGIEELARLLGVAVGQQLHRALEVGEQHGDLLALALEGALRGEDLLGEVLGGVGLGLGDRGAAADSPATARRRTARRTCFPGASSRATLRAGEREAAPHSSQNRASVAVLGVAPGTRHGRGGAPPP